MSRCLALVLGALAACGGGDGNDPGVDAPGPTADADPFATRPFELFVPSGYAAGTPAPLVVVLHGYGIDGLTQEAFFQLRPVAEAETFLYAMPNGSIDGAQNNYWNASDACCDVGHLGVDDVGYLRALIDDVRARYTVDDRRIYVVGHSNGGFMAHRLACDLSTEVAAIVSLAGVTWSDPARCTATEPVAIAQVHGTADTVILYGGGMVYGLSPYPSVDDTVAMWRTRNGCTGTGTPSTIDLDEDVVGAETTVTPATGCDPGGDVELWSMAGSGHIPGLQPAWAPTVWAFFAAHPKP